MEVESTDARSSSEDVGKENSRGSKPNGSNNTVDVDTGNSDSLNVSENTQMPNTEVGNTETNNDNSSSAEVIDEGTNISALQGHERVVIEIVKETETSIVVVSVTDEAEPRAEETEEDVNMSVEVSPVIENRIVVHEYPSAGIDFYPPFDASFPYHQLVGGFSVPIGYAENGDFQQSDYDYHYSSSSSDEDSKAFVAKSQAKMNHAKRAKPSTPLNDQRFTYNELMKRKAEDDKIDDRQHRRDQIRRRVLATEENLRSQDDGVPSDSDASENEPVWVPRDRKIKPNRRNREIAKQVEADWDSSDPDIHPDFVNGPDNDSDEEEDYEKDDDDDSDRSDDSDESDD
ncbi:uncharacterized protein LOC113324412 [Papaver somniferum]|uniref:uncharacterized protein LOC113324412 n=1 Tax=Papaver somniferum TaxID=3469 RepID=UPI000E6FE966|nr:uncharacterized protein LOC113324412 [Papaver somniferum]